MALFKILKGNSSRISTDVTPFDEGCMYFTSDDGGLYIDSADGDKKTRVRVNPKQEPCSTTVSLNLVTSGWNGSEAPFTQTLSVPGITADTDGIISVSQSATTDQRLAARSAMLQIIGQNDNSLIIAADGELPTYDIPVDIILFDI